MPLLVSWEDVSAEVDKICSANPDIDDGTIRNAKALITFSQPRYPVADDVGPRYWPTINFSWTLKAPQISVEVFPDRYEFYRFREKQTEIKHVEASEDQTFPEAMMHLLDGVLLDGGLGGTSV